MICFHYKKYRNFVRFPAVEILKKHSFRMVLGESSKTMPKLCLSMKLPDQEIKQNDGIFCSFSVYQRLPYEI